MTSAINDLLDADSTNVECAKQIIRQLDPSILELFDNAAEMYTTFGRCLGQSPVFANTASVRANAARTIVALSCHRQFMWGVTDLFRTRMTPALGYARQQAESVALLHLFRDEPNAAVEWSEIQTDKQGKGFYQVRQPQLRATMQKLGLAAAYECGSNAALHVRLRSVASALSCRRPGERSPRDGGGISLGFQEFEPADPFRYYLVVLYFLHTQVRVFESLTLAFPEAYDPIWSERVRRFSACFQAVREGMTTKYPDEVRDLEVSSDRQVEVPMHHRTV